MTGFYLQQSTSLSTVYNLHSSYRILFIVFMGRTSQNAVHLNLEGEYSNSKWEGGDTRCILCR